MNIFTKSVGFESLPCTEIGQFHLFPGAAHEIEIKLVGNIYRAELGYAGRAQSENSPHWADEVENVSTNEIR